MNVSAKTEYACVALLELALQYGTGRPVRIRDIAQANGIPARFLVQILLQLKSAGIVQSTRGAAGGYRLAREPAELTLADVVTVGEGPPQELASSAARPTIAARTMLAAWREIAAVERELLEATTFADLAARVRGQTEQMYYI
jgi:Rrf2 family protein